MPVPITALYAALMGVLLFVLDLHVGRLRGRLGVPLYDGGHRELAVAVRQHGNFTEHVPLVLILMALVELNGASGWVVHLFGLGLLVGRAAHPFGLRDDKLNTAPRAVGAGLTGLVTLAASALAAWQFLG